MKSWINWTTIATAAILGLCGWIGRASYKVYAEHRQLVAEVSSHLVADQQRQAVEKSIKDVLAQVATEVSQIRMQTLTVVGLARTTPGDEVFVMVNSAGRAAQYIGASRAKVTNLSAPNSLSMVVNITGTFRNEDENLILVVSKKTAVLLGSPNMAVLKLRIEPAPEKK